MKRQLAFLIYLYAVGLGFHLPFLRRLNATFLALSALPLGLMFWVALLSFALLLRIPLHFGPLLMAIGLLSSARVWFAWRRGIRPRREEVIPAVAVLLVHIAIGLAVTRFDFSMMSPDGIIVSHLGRLIAEKTQFHWSMTGILPDWGIFAVLTQAASYWLGSPYLHMLQPMLAGSVFNLTAWSIYHGLTNGVAARRSSAIAFAGLATTGMATGLFFLFNTFYIHNGMPAALYLLLAFVSFRQLNPTDQGPSLSLAWMSLFGLILTRPEGPILSVVVAFAAMSTMEFRRKEFLRRSLAVTVATIAWYCQLAALSDETSEVINPLRAALTTAPMLAVPIIAMLSGTKLVGLQKWAGRSMVILALIATLVAIAVRGNDLEISLKWIAMNLLYTGRWGFSWIVLVAAFPMAWMAGSRLRREESFGIVLLTFPLLVILMGSMRVPYRFGWGDTANRMFIHVFPLATLYLALKLGPGVCVPRRTPSANATRTSP